MSSDLGPTSVAAWLIAAFCKAKRGNTDRAARYLSMNPATLYAWLSGKCVPAPRNSSDCSTLLTNENDSDEILKAHTRREPRH